MQNILIIKHEKMEMIISEDGRMGFVESNRDSGIVGSYHKHSIAKPINLKEIDEYFETSPLYEENFSTIDDARLFVIKNIVSNRPDYQLITIKSEEWLNVPLIKSFLNCEKEMNLKDLQMKMMI